MPVNHIDVSIYPPAARLGLLTVYDDKLSNRAYTITRKTQFNEKYKITETIQPCAAVGRVCARCKCTCVQYWQYGRTHVQNLPSRRFPRCSRVLVRCVCIYNVQCTSYAI